MTTSQFEHQSHEGSNYRSKPLGQKIAIIGYLHHTCDLASDHEEASRICLEKVIGGKHPQTQFFHQISAYFGEGNSFWNDVVFFNFLPRAVDSAHDGRFRWGKQEEKCQGQTRFLRALETYKPDIVFVFSGKAWKSLPESLEDKNGQQGREIIQGGQYQRHHYPLSNGKFVQVFGFRHPQGASKDEMTRNVTAALQMKPAPPISTASR